jgi:hypothetical protein
VSWSFRMLSASVSACEDRSRNTCSCVDCVLTETHISATSCYRNKVRRNFDVCNRMLCYRACLSPVFYGRQWCWFNVAVGAKFRVSWTIITDLFWILNIPTTLTVHFYCVLPISTLQRMATCWHQLPAEQNIIKVRLLVLYILPSSSVDPTFR